MKKAKKKTKASVQKTALDRITTKLRTALRRETTNIIEIGKLLSESCEHLEHGKWQSWLAENFDLSYRSAIRYVEAAEYVERKGKSDTVSLFENLAPTVLYALGAGHYNEQEEAAILATTRKGRVDQGTVSAICEAFAPDDDDADDADDEDDGGEDAIAAEDDPEIGAILDGSPPVLPQAPTLAPPNFALRDFDQAIDTLKRLMTTKRWEQFIASIHSSGDLEHVIDFIRAVIRARIDSAPSNMESVTGASR
jgi:Protein of unknown function (DUF3102)